MLLCVQTVLGPEATTANKTDHIPGPVELMFRPQMSEHVCLKNKPLSQKLAKYTSCLSISNDEKVDFFMR